MKCDNCGEKFVEGERILTLRGLHIHIKCTIKGVKHD